MCGCVSRGGGGCTGGGGDFGEVADGSVVLAATAVSVQAVLFFQGCGREYSGYPGTEPGYLTTLEYPGTTPGYLAIPG